jgi:Bifunctional DNA primase/polymerase, N-terminal/AAA domain
MTPVNLQAATFQERADSLVAHGIPVIPLKSRSKAPATEHGAHDASLDPKQITNWAKQFSNGNCAAVATYDGHWFQDDDAGTLAERYKADTGRDLPITLRVKTSRGFHYYFRHDEASRLIRYGGKENSGVIDIPGYKGEARCNYQYVVGPGSVHPSGAVYEITHDTPIIAAPVELLEWLQKAYALSESLKAKNEEKITRKHKASESGFRKLFDAAGYRPLVRRINASDDINVHIDELRPGGCVPCPMPRHKHADYTPCFGPLQSAPELLHCLGNCGWSGDMVAACYKLDGGAKKYQTMYDCARAICEEEGLKFEDFFPAKAQDAPIGEMQSGGLTFTVDAVTVTKGSSFEYILAPAYSKKVDGWFPLGSVSLVGGSSGAGKSSMMLDLCQAQSRMEIFWGHATFGRNYLVLMQDRGKGAQDRTMARLGLDAAVMPIRYLPFAVDAAASMAIINQIETYHSERGFLPQLVFIEGMDMLVSDPNKMEIVAPFLKNLQKIAEHFHCAVVGSVGAPKMKPKDTYTAKRDSVFGSAVWSRMADTIVVVQYENGDDTAATRVISVLLRNGKAEQFRAEFSDDGRLVAKPVERHSEVSRDVQQAADWIQQHLRDNGRQKGTDVVDVAREKHNIKASIIKRARTWLSDHKVIEVSGGRSGWTWELNQGSTEEDEQCAF